MDCLVILLLSIGMGLVSVEMFGKGWLGLLGMAAALILRLKGLIGPRRLTARLHEALVRVLLCFGLLILAFTVYVRHLGLGFEEQHMIAYFVAAAVRLAMFMRSLPAEVEALFDTGRDRCEPP